MSMGKTKVAALLGDVLVVGPGVQLSSLGPNRTFQASGETSAGVGAATIDIEVSNDDITYVAIDTLSLVLGTVTTGDVFALNAPYKYVRANVKTISGTDATVRVDMGIEL